MCIRDRCACDYAEEFEVRSSGVGLSFEQPGLTETPWRGKNCSFVCPGYDMKSMDSVCSGHGRCETDARCACDQGWTGYKCDLPCETEQKPLSCSGHGVCNERKIERPDITEQLYGVNCDSFKECDDPNYNEESDESCTNETMFLARDRVVEVGNRLYHMYKKVGMFVDIYMSPKNIEILGVETKTFTSPTIDFKGGNEYVYTVAIDGDDYTNPEIIVCQDFSITKSIQGHDFTISGTTDSGSAIADVKLSGTGTTSFTDFQIGSYTYKCDSHPAMTGIFTVQFCEADKQMLSVRSGDEVGLNPTVDVCEEFEIKQMFDYDNSGADTSMKLVMSDSYGDGWNNYQLRIGGGYYTMGSGSYGTRTIPMPDETVVELESDGSYYHEVSWVLECNVGGQVLATHSKNAGFRGPWTFENICGDIQSTGIYLGDAESSKPPLKQLFLSGDRFDITASVGDYYTVANSKDLTVSGRVNVIDCSGSTRPISIDDFNIEGKAVRHNFNFTSHLPFMPCVDRTTINREQASHPLLPETTPVTLPCNVYARKNVREDNFGREITFYNGYDVMCGMCKCEENSQTGNWTGYDCRTPALGFYRSDARSQCPGMTKDMRPCNGGGTCKWGSIDGYGIDISSSATSCYCGDTSQDATLETAPRYQNGIMVHAESFGTPLFYDIVETFQQTWQHIEYEDTYLLDEHCDQNSSPYTIRGASYAGSDNPGTDYESRKRACYDACKNKDGANILATNSVSNPNFWDENTGDDVHLFIIKKEGASSQGRCYCISRGTADCSPGLLFKDAWATYDSYAMIPPGSVYGCPNGTELIEYAKDCRSIFTPETPYEPNSFILNVWVDSDKKIKIHNKGALYGATNPKDMTPQELMHACYKLCISSGYDAMREAGQLNGDNANFWSRYSTNDVTHFDVITAGDEVGLCSCYIGSDEDPGDSSDKIRSKGVIYKVLHNKESYDLSLQSINDIPALHPNTKGTCGPGEAARVMDSTPVIDRLSDIKYFPAMIDAYCSSGFYNALQADGSVDQSYPLNLQPGDVLFDPDKAKECANRCIQSNKVLDGFWLRNEGFTYEDRCRCGSNCGSFTPNTNYDSYIVRVLPNIPKLDTSTSLCRPSPLALSNYKSDCSCKFGWTGSTCETARMMCLWSGEETDGTECICKNTEGHRNQKTSKYGCCTKGTYWEQERYSSFTPLVEFIEIPESRFYMDAFLYVCKAPETYVNFIDDQSRITAIHNYVVKTDEYLLTRPTVCDTEETSKLFTPVFKSFAHQPLPTFTVITDLGNGETSELLIAKDSKQIKHIRGVDPAEECASFCVEKNRGWKGFSLYTPKPVLVEDTAAPVCMDDDWITIYNGITTGADADPNPGRHMSGDDGILDTCRIGCLEHHRYSVMKSGMGFARPKNFWDVYTGDDITHIFMTTESSTGHRGRCRCFTDNLETCETTDLSSWGSTWSVEHQDSECTCEPHLTFMDTPEHFGGNPKTGTSAGTFHNPLHYHTKLNNEAISTAELTAEGPVNAKRYDIVYPYDIDAQNANMRCFENIDGTIKRINEDNGTPYMISVSEIGYVDQATSTTKTPKTFIECFQACLDDGYTIFQSWSSGGCRCFISGSDPKDDGNTYFITSVSTDVLMRVQKEAVTNPAPCNIDSYIAIGDDTIAADCNCPIDGIAEAYVREGYERTVLSGICNRADTQIGMVPRRILPISPTERDGQSNQGRCDGDCDANQCLPHLTCFQRDTSDGTNLLPIPGCSNSLNVNMPESHDYCVDHDLQGLKPISDSYDEKEDGKIPRCGGDCDEDSDCGPGLVCLQRDPSYDNGFSIYKEGQKAPACTATPNDGHNTKSTAPLTDPNAFCYNEDKVKECGCRCLNTVYEELNILGLSMFQMRVEPGSSYGHCFCIDDIDDCVWMDDDRFSAYHTTRDGGKVPGCSTVPSRSNWDYCVPGEWATLVEPPSKERCSELCDESDSCNSFSITDNDIHGCVMAHDCDSFDYQFAGSCSGGSDTLVGQVQSAELCRNECADAAGFIWNSDYKRCYCESITSTAASDCHYENIQPSATFSRWSHNFQLPAANTNSRIYKKKKLASTKGKYCAEGEQELYRAGILEIKADDFACAQHATGLGLELSRGENEVDENTGASVFVCYGYARYYGDPDHLRPGDIACPGGLQNTKGRPQYVLKNGLLRENEISLAPNEFQNQIFDSKVWEIEYDAADETECVNHCSPFKYRHFVFDTKFRKCICIPEARDELQKTGDILKRGLQLYDFSQGLINNIHDMCHCEGFSIVDGVAQACSTGRYSNKKTRCSATCELSLIHI